MQAQVKHTQIYKYGTTRRLVTKGTLILIKNEKCFPEIGMLGSSNVKPMFVWTQKHIDSLNSLPENSDACVMLPIIVSHVELINVGDIFIEISWGEGLSRQLPPIIAKRLDNDGTEETGRFQAEKIGGGKFTSGLFKLKVLALHENFSPIHLQYIIDGELKNGSEVFVECESKEIYALEDESRSDKIGYGIGCRDIVTSISLSDNHVKLFHVKDNQEYDFVVCHIGVNSEGEMHLYPYEALMCSRCVGGVNISVHKSQFDKLREIFPTI